MRTAIGLVLACALCCAQTAPDVYPVYVDVLVRGKAGAVKGLAKDDFVLKDKGKAQKLEVFAATAAHDADFKPAPLGPGVAANRLSGRGEPVRAATFILFDRLNTAAADQAFARGQVLNLLASLKETDTVAFASLSRNFILVHDFTDDPAPLIRSARRLLAGGTSQVESSAAEMALQRRLETALTSAQEIDQVYRAAATPAAFRSIAQHLSGLPGRKNLVWVAQSFPLTFGNDVYRRNETANEMASTTAILQEDNVAVYPVSPGGVGAGFSDTSSRTDRPTEGALMPGANAATQQQTAGALGDASNMQTIATATGGRAFYNLNDIVPSMRTVLDEAEYSYTLGFYADPKGLDDKFHSLDVDVLKGKAQGAEVRFRKRYLATKQNMRQMTPPIPQLAVEPLVATGLGIAAVAQPDAAKPGSVKVQVSVNPGDLTFQHVGDKWTTGFDLALLIEGAPVNTGTAKTFNLNLTDEQRTQVLTAGLLIEGAIPSKGAPDVIRVVVREKATGAAGSVRVVVVQ